MIRRLARKDGWLDRKVDVDVGGEDGDWDAGTEDGWLGEPRGKQGPTRAIEGAREGNSTPTQVRPTDPGRPGARREDASSAGWRAEAAATQLR